jgi:hypothetical protein
MSVWKTEISTALSVLRARCLTRMFSVSVSRRNGCLEEGPPIIPCFESTEVARNFARRNLPKSWLRGVVNLTMRDTQWIDKKGWRIVLYDFPKKLKDVVPFDIEVLEYDEEPKIIGI